MHREIELYGLRIAVSIAMASDLRELVSKYYAEGASDVLFLIEPQNRQFFETEFKATVAGLRGSDDEPGKCYLVLRKNLRHAGDGVLAASTEYGL